MRANLDANASVRPIPEVLDFLRHYSGEFLNPSSVHQAGQAAKKVLDEAREELALLLGLKNNEKIIFTSGATEANNAALRPIYAPSQSDSFDFACSSVEHTSVLECLRNSKEKGYKLHEFSPESLINPNSFSQEYNEDLRIYALMAANNETGQIFDIKKIASAVRNISPRVRIHCDAVQAIGKIKINFQEFGVDSMSVSGHKIGAVSGIGALIISEHCQLESWQFGGPQQYGLRAGTENVLGIKTLAIACREARSRLDSGNFQMCNAKNTFVDFLSSLGAQAIINLYGNEQLPNTISVRFPGVKADDLVVALDLCGVCISAGSACDSGRPSPSHVLLSHGMSEIEAKETIRVSFEPLVSKQEIEFAISAIKETISRMTSFRRAA